MRVLLLALAATLLAACGPVINSPYAPGEERTRTLFLSFQERPKYLDPVTSYSLNETPWVYAIYESPYTYHYLRRPYEIAPMLASEMPRIRLLDRHGRDLPADAPAAQVAETVYTIPLKRGVRYQPHPALARDARGRFLYQDLTPADIDGRYAVTDFPLGGAATTTREVTAEDFVYQIKRLASPYVSTRYVSMPSPLYGLLADHVVDMKGLGDRLRAERAARLEGRPLSDSTLPWRDLREVPFAGARALDDHTLELRLEGTYPQMRFWLTLRFFVPIPWEADRFYAQPGMAEHALTLNQWPIGTGPFMLVEQSPTRYVMARNPNYRGEPYPCEGMPGDRERGLLDDCGKPTPFVDRVVSSLEKERQPTEAKVLQGFYDVPDIERLDVGFNYEKWVMDETPRGRELTARGLQLPSSVEPSNWYMGFNWLDPVVGKGDTPERQARNRKLRQAISIATDWEEHATVFFDIYGRAEVAMGPVPPGLFGHRGGEAGVNPVTHVWKDGRAQRRPLEDAKRLLAEAGYPGGRDAQTGRPLVLYYDSNGVGPAYQSRLDWQVKQMARLGIQLEIRSADYNRFQDRMRKGLAQIFFWGWNADYPDPENFLFLLHGPQSKVRTDGENAANYENPAYDRLFERMRDLPDGPERQEVIDRMVRLVQEDAVWMFGLFPGSTGVYQGWVRNGKPSGIIKDTARVLRVDVSERAAKLAEWNRPRPWPLVVVPAGLLALFLAGRTLWRRRELATARQAAGEPLVRAPAGAAAGATEPRP